MSNEEYLSASARGGLNEAVEQGEDQSASDPDGRKGADEDEPSPESRAAKYHIIGPLRTGINGGRENAISCQPRVVQAATRWYIG